MIINLDKFLAIILDKKKSNLTNIPLTIDSQTIKSVPLVQKLPTEVFCEKRCS